MYNESDGPLNPIEEIEFLMHEKVEEIKFFSERPLTDEISRQYLERLFKDGYELTVKVKDVMASVVPFTPRINETDSPLT